MNPCLLKIDGNKQNIKAIEQVERFINKKKITMLRKSFAEGKDLAEAQCSNFLASWRRALALGNEKKIDCITSLAQALLVMQLEKYPELIVPMTIKLLKNIAEHTDVEINVHSIHAPILRDHVGEISIACASTRKVCVVSDDALDMGSIIVKANKSVVDAQLKTQLNKARELLIMTKFEGKDGASY